MVAEEGEPSQGQSNATAFQAEQQELQRGDSSLDNVFLASGDLRQQQETGEQQTVRQQQNRSMRADSQQITSGQQRSPESGRESLSFRSFSLPMAGENSFSHWKRSMRRWLKSAVLYARCRPLLVLSFIFFSAAHVLLSVTFLRLFPCPLLLTWAQLSQSVFYAFILGEAGDAFAAFRSLFPRVSRTLYRAYAAVAAQRASRSKLPHGGWQSSTTTTAKRSRRSADGLVASSSDETDAEVFWKHRSGLLLQLLLRLLPYSLGFCFLQYAHNVLVAHVLHPLQLPIVSSLALAGQEIIFFLSRMVGSTSKPAGYSLRKHVSSSIGLASPGRGAAEALGSQSPGETLKEREPGAEAATETAQEASRTTYCEGGRGEIELTPAENISGIPTGEGYEASTSVSPFSSEISAALSRKYTLPGTSVTRSSLLTASCLMRVLSLLFLGGGPGLYIYWQSSSPLFAAAAALFILASLLYRSWLLPKALHLPRCSTTSNNKGRAAPTAAASQQSAAHPTRGQKVGESCGRIPARATDPHGATHASSSSPLSLIRRESSSSSSAIYATSCFRPKEISLLHNLTGALLLLLPGLCCGEQHYTTFPFRFLLSHRWDDWLAAGCWISLGTVSFLRRTTSSSIMREAGASIWELAELLALLCVGCGSWFLFGNPGPAAAACCCIVILGRLLNLVASPLVHHHRHSHYHHLDTLLQEKQQQQRRILPTSSAAALVVTSVSPGALDRSPLSHDPNSSFQERSLSRRFSTRFAGPGVGDSSQQQALAREGSISGRSNSNDDSTGRGGPSSLGGGNTYDRRSSSSSTTSQTTAGVGRGDYIYQRSSGPSLSQSYSRNTYGTRDDMPSFTFPSSGRRSFAVWSLEAASRAAAAAELPGVRLLEEPEIFLRPHRGHFFGRRFASGSASLSEYDTSSFRNAASMMLPWDGAATQALPLTDERSISSKRAAGETLGEGRRALSVIGEEEEEEDDQRQRTMARPPFPEDVRTTTIAVPPAPQPGEAGEEDEEDEYDEEAVAAASKRGYLMEVVRAYVSRTSFEDLLLLEEWGGTTGVAAAVGANLLEGLPDERRHARDSSSSSSSSENEEGSTTEDEVTEAEEEFSSAVAPAETRIISSRASHVAADGSAAPTGHAAAAAARGWPENIPRRRKRRSQRGGGRRQKSSSVYADDKEEGQLSKELFPVAENGREGVTTGKGEFVQEQRRLYGVNRLPRRPLSSFFSLCLEAASDATLKVLMFCGLMSLVLALLFSKEPETEVIEGLAIWVAVLVVVLVTAGNDWMKEQQFALLSAVKEDKHCAVIRGGEAKQLSVFDVVVGDLLQLEAGDEIPADALLVQGRDVKVDESSLTGESDPIAKEVYSVCMQAVNQLQRQQQLPPMEKVLPRSATPEKPSTQKQVSHQDEEGESLVVSTAAESIHMAPLSYTTLIQQDIYHSSPAPSSSHPSPTFAYPASRSPMPSSASLAETQSLHPPLHSPSTQSRVPDNNLSDIHNSTNAATGTVAAGTKNTDVPAEGSITTKIRGTDFPPDSVATGSALAGNVAAAPNHPSNGNAAADGVVTGSPSYSFLWRAPELRAEATLSPCVSPSGGGESVLPPPGDASSPCCILARHHLVPSPVLLSGTTISTGNCTALVVAVGSYSQVGQTFQKLAFDPEPTPLQMKLNALAEDIGNFGLAAAVAAFLVLLLEFWVLFYMQPATSRATVRAVDILHEHVEFFVTAITILVVAVPEGLPLAVTISLAYSISQMLRDQNYVRRLAACEIMGGANEICSDKTGTLTKNQMTVTVFWQGTSPLQKETPASSSLLLYIPVGTTTTENTETKDEVEEAKKAKAQKDSVSTPTFRDQKGALSAREENHTKLGQGSTTPVRGGRSGDAATAAGFSKEYTQPLLEAELTTTGRSTEAETIVATRRSIGKNADNDAPEGKYAAWSKGEEKRQHDRKWFLLAEAIAVNSTAFLEREEDEGDDSDSIPGLDGDNNIVGDIGDTSAQDEAAPGKLGELTVSANTRYKHVGSPTECALLAFTMFQCHKNYDLLRKHLLGEEGCNLVERREFTSDRKMMTSIIRLSPEALALEKRFLKHEEHMDTSQAQYGDKRPPDSSQGVSPPQVGGYRVFVKGAAERVLGQCSHVLVSDDEKYALTSTLRSEIEEQVINTMASRALRTICIAYKDLPPGTRFSSASSSSSQDANDAAGNLSLDGSSPGRDSEKISAIGSNGATPNAPPASGRGGGTAGATLDSATGVHDTFENDLICLGIAGIEDPVREEVPEAVLQCQAAGIRVRMVTGDNLLTARAIAAQCNIYHEESGGLALLGSDFIRRIGGVVCQRCGTEVCDCATDSKTAEEGRPLRIDVIKNLEAFQEIWKRLEVLARSQPTDKYALVCALQQLRRVVAVTGDGTNDAPALRKADVGFAMGLSGKEVAKQAADIVMLDDNFTCIVKAVRWGRSVYDNIRRFLQFQLTVNVVAVLLTVICVAIEREAPLSAVQMLWINLIMDSFASLALATEPPTDALLQRKPHGRDSYLVSRVMLASILVAACYQVTVMLLLIFYGERFLPETPWKFVAPQQRLKYKFCEFSDGVPEHCMYNTLIHTLSFDVCNPFHGCCYRQLHPSSCEITKASLHARNESLVDVLLLSQAESLMCPIHPLCIFPQHD